MEQQKANKSYSLTKAQKRVWFNSKLSDKPLPNIVMVFELHGALDIWALRKAIETLVDENSVLKSTIYSSKDHLERIINPAVRGNLEIVDLTQAEKKTDIFWLLQNIAGVTFNLGTGPLFYFHLIKESENHFYFSILIHPIIVDRHSLKYLIEEISRYYNLIAQNTEASHKEELFDFNLIVELEKKFSASEKCHQGLTHWTNTLKSNQFHLDLPKKGYFGSQEYVDSPFFEVHLAEDLCSRVKKFSETHQVDLSTVLLATYQALLQRYTGSNDIIINYSSPVSYTDRKVFGCLDNRLPVRVLLNENMSFNEILKMTKTQLAYDQYYKDIQINDIVKSIRDKYDSHFSGIFSNTSFEVNYLPYNQLCLGNIKATLIPKFMKKFATENLALYYHDAGKTIAFIADFDEHLDATAVKNLLQHYVVLLDHCIQSPTKSIATQPLLTPEEYQQIIFDWNNNQTEYPQEFIHRQFEQQVVKTPDKIAMVYQDQQMTYQEVNSLANQLARVIAKALAEYRDSDHDLLVGLCLDRGLEMVVGKLAILKAGAAYVPLDPQFPQERLSYILNDSNCRALITKQDLLDENAFFTHNNRSVICLDTDARKISRESADNLTSNVNFTNLAYVIYTSGSTGLPKGVMIEHKSIPNLLHAWKKHFAITPQSRVLQFVSMNFDVAVPDVFCTLTNGACLYIASEEMKQSPEKLYAFLETHKVSAAFITPAFLRLLPKGLLPDLRILSFGGDVCDPETADFWMKDRIFINGYGPTETTVAATYSDPLKPGDAVNRIGKPLPNLQAYILDKNLNPVPVGILGELHIGGIGVGRGYINRNDLTAERFIADPFTTSDDNARIYKTGDLVRWAADGNIEYVGRADFEVKIRGFRIQLNDIEYVLQSFPGITQVTTKVWEKSGMEKTIAAYYVLQKGASANTKELREHIQKYLPDYMVPSYLIELDDMPIAVSGKINKSLLPDPTPRATSGTVENREEQVLKDIWVELFKVSADAVTGHSDFFDLGGHSLLATQLVSRIKNRLNIDITVKDVFQNSQLKQLAKVVRESQSLQVTRFVLEKAPEQTFYEPSFSQMRLWYFTKTTACAQTYNILSTIMFSKNVDIMALRKALVKLFTLNEVFKTSFVENQGEVHIKLHETVSCDIPIVDCQSKEEIQAEIEKEKNHIFDLNQLPLFRCKLLLSEEHGVTLLFNIHHIIFDGWSLDVFMRELGEIYAAIVQNNPLQLSVKPIEFKDLALSQKNWEKAGLFNEQMTYWQRKLFKPLPILELPTDYRRPTVAGFEGDAVRFDLPTHLVAITKKLAATNKSSLFSLFLSVYYILLNRVTHQNDLIVSSPIANRTQQELEQLIGLCANVVAYRAQFHDEMSFDELLKAVNEDVINTQENQDVPLDIIVNQLQTSRDTSRNPVFQTMFVLQNGFKLENQWSETQVNYQIIEEHTKTSKFDITLILYDNSNEDKISGYFEFNTGLFAKETIERYVQYFINILHSIAENAQRTIDNIPLLPSAEYTQLTQHWNQTGNQYHHETVHRAFEQQVDAAPTHIAVVFQHEKLTYHELNTRANQLASYIRKQYQSIAKQPLAPDTFIGLCIDRSVDMIIGMLAILKAGAAYLPLDPGYPQDRLTYMLNDAGVKMILSKQALIEKCNFLKSAHTHIICIDTKKPEIERENPVNLSVETKPTDLAYIIYTSGSTGLPKGVMIEHKGVPNLAYARRDIFHINQQSRILHFASINFDSAVCEIFETLLNGASLYIVSEEQRSSPEKLLDFMQTHQITFTTLPPALLRILPRRELPMLQDLAFAGDICDQETIEYWSQNRRFYNLYGPTETTVCATASLLEQGAPSNRIGKPLSNFKVFVLDKDLSPVPVGVFGELYIGGIGLARGYLNRPDLTVERFIVNPFSDDPAERIYKTGDVVRWRQDGEIEFIGRSDFQIQIRGFRVELGEIEEILSQHHAIKQVAVTTFGEDITKQLVAYFSQHNTLEHVPVDDLRKYLQSKLPDYMVPSAFIRIDKMPLSPSGKIDKKALPQLDEAMVVAQNHFVAPRTETESKLVHIWGDLFNHQKIGVRDNFFDFGGNSLLSIRMLARVKEVLGREISLAKFFQHPTIEGLADLVAGHDQGLDRVAAILGDAEEQVVMHRVTYPAQTEVRHILLTGANGFLGVYLLESLLNETEADIYCVIRAKDLSQAKEKLNAALIKFSIIKALDNSRVHIILGDLSREKLGMDAEQWRFLEETIDVVYHNGALVNHIYDYQILKSTNVGSTKELLRLCATQKPKSFHFISTGAAASQFDEQGVALEAGPGNKPLMDIGYILSKWVAEKIIYRAAEQGLKVAIYRPGNITGHSKTGEMNFENNHSLMLLKSCVQLGVAPKWQAILEMTPVDILSCGIIKLSLRADLANKQAYNMGNPNGFSWAEYFALVNKQGFQLKLISPEEWRDQYIKHIAEDNALYPLKEMYTGEHVDLEQFHFETRETQKCLKDLDVHYPENYVEQITIYLTYLKERAFIRETLR
jgi:amino acid adenylation domain-containing protein/thioester reductase-like protein